LEFLKPLRPGIGTAKAYEVIRKYVKPLENDRILYDDLQTVLSLVQNDVILREVEKTIKLF